RPPPPPPLPLHDALPIYPAERRPRGDLPRDHPQHLERLHLGGGGEPPVEIGQVHHRAALGVPPRLLGEHPERRTEVGAPAPDDRSEEHTSELPSLTHLAC